MGICCEISLHKPADGRYTYQAGGIVSGGIRYYLDKEYVFTSITVSLKGFGKIYFEEKEDGTDYRNEETYVDIDDIIYPNEKTKSLPKGQYENQFSFQLPYDIPASLEYKNSKGKYYARCVIKYYVRIKFERPGPFFMNKHFKKEVDIISAQKPRLRTKPLIYGDQKSLLQLRIILGEKSVVKLKATITNSVLRPEESVQVNYEIENKTNVDINRVEVKFLTVDKYTSKKGFQAKIRSEVEEGIVFTYGAIPVGETATFSAEIMVPSSFASIDNSRIIGRDYSVLTTVVLPMPHSNMTLEIPFQVIATPSGSFGEFSASTSTAGHYSDELPTYWEAMGEEIKELLDNDVMYSAEKGEIGMLKS